MLESRHFPLVIEQPLLTRQSAAVAGKRSVGADHAMAGDDDAAKIIAIRARNGADRSRLSDTPGDVSVGTRFTGGNLQQLIPNAPLKFGAAWRERQRKNFPLAIEIFIDFVCRLIEHRMRSRHDGELGFRS